MHKYNFFNNKANILLVSFFGILLYMGHMKGFVTILSLFCILVFITIPFRRYIDSVAFLLILFTFLYTIIGFSNGFMNTFSEVVSYTLPLIFFYCFGRYIQYNLTSKNQFLLFIAFVITFYSLEIYSSIIQNIISTGSIVNLSRQFYFGGDETRRLTATLVGLNAAIGFAGLPIFLILKEQKFLKWYFFILFLLSLITTIHLVNRTGLIVSIFSFIITIMYYYRNKRFNIIFIVIICLVLFICLEKVGIINQDIIDAYSNRNEEGLLTAGGRVERWEEALQQLILSPFGWAENNGHTVYYIHNMWLDIAKVTGIIPCSLLIIGTIKSVKSLLILMQIKQDIIIATFLVLNVCFFLSCFVEPVYGGLHLFLYVMLWGMQNQYLKNPKLS